ncbi:hypothetical protein F5Y04DRAFT_83609 [Hypomontagnella monticulosa]|nr:hypothetical protein F5Y04DRAFT_83609 [Hypomontagnella monticulosa]
MPQTQVMHRTSRVDLAVPTDPCSVAAGPGSSFFSLHIPEPSALPLQSRPSKGDLDVPGLSCSTRWLTSRHQISFVAQPERPLPITPMMDRFHPFESLRSVVQNALPNIAIESINPLPSSRLMRFFNVKVSDGRTLLLTLPPPPTLRLLRIERPMNLSETLVTRWILEAILESNAQANISSRGRISISQLIEGPSVKEEERNTPERTRESKDDVLKFLPILVAHSPSPSTADSSFNLFEPTRGTPITDLTPHLTTSEKNIVDFEQGQLVRQLSEFTSPNGFFGPATAVISPQQTSASSPDLRGTQVVSSGFRGTRTWKQAFHSLLEAVLRDAEDMAVMISYEPIRGYFNRLSHVLDGVTTSRLVILDASDPSNTLVSRSPKPTDEDTKRGQTETATGKVAIKQEQRGSGGDAPEQPTIAVTGLRDWGNCIFGDPLMAEAFSQNQTSEFLRGFRKPRGPSSSHLSPPSSSAGGGDSDIEYDDDHLVEDRENAPARLLLYECYHATVGVVKQFYRPGPNSSDREIAARRRLAAALRRLEEVEDEFTGKRPRRPSANVEAWPVKKPKGEQE